MSEKTKVDLIVSAGGVALLQQKPGEGAEALAQLGLEDIVEAGTLGILLWTAISQLAGIERTMRQLTKDAAEVKKSSQDPAKAVETMLSTLRHIAPQVAVEIERHMPKGIGGTA